MWHTKLYIIYVSITEQKHLFYWNLLLWNKIETVPKFYQKHKEDSQSFVSLLHEWTIFSTFSTKRSSYYSVKKLNLPGLCNLSTLKNHILFLFLLHQKSLCHSIYNHKNSFRTLISIQWVFNSWLYWGKPVLIHLISTLSHHVFHTKSSVLYLIIFISWRGYQFIFYINHSLSLSLSPSTPHTTHIHHLFPICITERWIYIYYFHRKKTIDGNCWVLLLRNLLLNLWMIFLIWSIDIFIAEYEVVFDLWWVQCWDIFTMSPNGIHKKVFIPFHANVRSNIPNKLVESRKNTVKECWVRTLTFPPFLSKIIS